MTIRTATRACAVLTFAALAVGAISGAAAQSQITIVVSVAAGGCIRHRHAHDHRARSRKWAARRS